MPEVILVRNVITNFPAIKIKIGFAINLLDLTTLDILGIVKFIAKPILILIAGKLVITFLTKITSGIMNKSHLDKGITGFIAKALKIALWVLTLIIVIDSLGVDTTSLVALVSVVSLALSLAFQNIMTNIFSGVIILFSKPFAVGDFVTISGISGTVREITLMRTKLTTADNKVEWIPNGNIESANITNYSAETMRRVEIKVSVSYDAPTDTVKKAVMEVLDKDERIIRNDEAKLPFVRLSAYNANDIEYTIRVWAENANYWGVYFDTLEALRESFAAHNIEFSYPHTVVHMSK